jgi:hypothetical protein
MFVVDAERRHIGELVITLKGITAGLKTKKSPYNKIY